jgi:hypothetical protein
MERQEGSNQQDELKEDKLDRVEGDPFSLSRMPTREEVEDFIRGMHGLPTVIYDSRKGEFERVKKRE